MNLTLEIARGLAALWVFMFHIHAMISNISPTLGKIAQHGTLGVPMFFVISGYCLYASASSTLAKGAKRASFIKRRLLRIYPPFWISIVVVVSMPYVIEYISSLKSGCFVPPAPRFFSYNIYDWTELVSLTKIFVNKGGDFQGAFTQLNAVYWSLAFEIQFYLIMYLSLLFNSRWTKFLFLIFLLSLISLSSDFLSNSGLFFLYWPTFSCGLALRALYERGVTPSKCFGSKSFMISSIVAVTMMVCLYFSILFSKLNDILAPFRQFHLEATVFALFIAALFWFVGNLEHHVDKNNIIQNSAFLKYLMQPLLMMGASSYSIYLLHAKVYEIPAMFSRQLVSPSNPLHILFTIIPTLVICYGFFWVAERPFMSTSHKKRIKGPIDEGVNDYNVVHSANNT